MREIYPDPSHQLPRPIIISGFALMATTVLLAAVAHATGIGTTTTPQPVAVVSRDLLFHEFDDGLLTVREASTGREIGHLDAGEGGFVRATMRALVRNRGVHSVPGDGVWRVARDASGDVWLQDVETKQNVDLGAFGPNQVQAFAAYLPPAAAPPATLPTGEAER